MSGSLVVDYGPAVEAAIGRIVAAVEAHPEIAARFPGRWLALELIDDGEELRRRIAGLVGGADVLAAVDGAAGALRRELGDRAGGAIAEQRYRWINEAVSAAVSAPADRPSMTDRIDRVVTNRWLGVPLFLAAMWVVFKLVADVSANYLDWIDGVMAGPVSRLVAAGMSAIGLGDTWVESLLVDGVVAGVGAVLVFVPVLMTLYLALALLEGSGYMARAALVMDRAMRAIGLPGRSFLPMMVGFGCTVPAIYATRTLARRTDRILTGLLVPFMSCGGRLPVYVLMAAVFFPRNRGAVVFSMYLLGITVALLLGLVLNRTVFAGNRAPPLMIELPDYRVPGLRSMWTQMWMRTSMFIREAGTIILGTSVVVWMLMAVPVGSGRFADVAVDDSAFGTVSSAVAPAFAPAGFGSWEATGALASGFVAKEVVVATLSQTYGVAEAESEDDAGLGEDLGDVVTGFVGATWDTLRSVPGIVGIDLVGGEDEEPQTGLMASIQDGFEETSGGRGALAGLAFLVFVLLYTPCVATAAASRRELGRRWMWSSVLGQTALAWSMAVIVFQSGRILGLG